MADQSLMDAVDPRLQRTYATGVPQASPTNKDSSLVLAPDPMVSILSAFYSIPAEYHADLFNDFKEAAEAKDLRRLLDTISDWAATAELYADEHLAHEVQQAISGHQELRVG